MHVCIYVDFLTKFLSQLRQQIVRGSSKQAMTMVWQSSSLPSSSTSSSESLLPQINDCVMIVFPPVDRPSKTSMLNIIGMIVGIDVRVHTNSHSHHLYRIATEHGCLHPLLSRTQFELCRQRDLLNIRNQEIQWVVSIREAERMMTMANSSSPSSSTMLLPPPPTKIFCYCHSSSCMNQCSMCRLSGVVCTDCCCHSHNNRTGRIDPEFAASFRCTNK